MCEKHKSYVFNCSQEKVNEALETERKRLKGINMFGYETGSKEDIGSLPMDEYQCLIAKNVGIGTINFRGLGGTF